MRSRSASNCRRMEGSILIAEFERVKELPVTSYRPFTTGIAPPDDVKEKAEGEGKGENRGARCLWCCNN